MPQNATSAPAKPDDPAPSGEGNASKLIDEAVTAALAKIEAAKDIDDLEKAVGLAKTSVEIQKTIADKNKATEETRKITIDAGLAARQMRVTLLSSIVVPIVSLLTVIVTLFVSYQQIRASSEQADKKVLDEAAAREEANWKAFLDGLDPAKSTADQLYSNPTFMARLKVFVASHKHDDELTDIIKKLMIGVTPVSAFQDLWKIQIKSVNPANLEQVVEIARAKKQKYDAIQIDCKRVQIPPGSLPEDRFYPYLGACSPTYSSDDLAKAFSDPAALKPLQALKGSMIDTSSTIQFLSERISDHLREAYNKAKGPKPLVLSNIWLIYSNLKDVDLSKADLNQTIFGTMILEGVILTPNPTSTDLPGSTWWDAEKIDQSMLPTLITYYYPANPKMVLPSGYSIARDQYVANVARLCTSNMKICSKNCIRFGQESNPLPSDCESQ